MGKKGAISGKKGAKLGIGQTSAALGEVSVMENYQENSSISEIVVKPQSSSTDVEEGITHEIDGEIHANIDEENLDAKVINGGEVDDFAEFGEVTAFPEPVLPQAREKQVKVA